MRLLVRIVVGVLAVLGVAASVTHFLTEPYNPGFIDHPVITRTHVVLGAVYLALAPWQLVRRIRSRAITYHRWAGRFLVTIGLLVGSTALFLGLVVPFSGHPERVVIGTFGGLFLTALLLGFRRVRQGRVAEHREWMLRAFAVGLSIATMRLIFIPSLAIVGDPTEREVAMLSTGSFALSFVVHALVAELWIRHTRTRAVVPVGAQRLVARRRGGLLLSRAGAASVLRTPAQRGGGGPGGAPRGHESSEAPAAVQPPNLCKPAFGRRR